jgi:hypothetical protein
MITNWAKKREGVWSGFIIFLDDDEEKAEIYDGQTWGEWFSNWFIR